MLPRRPELTFDPDEAAIAAYQQLLRSEWNLATLKGVLALLNSIVGNASVSARLNSAPAHRDPADGNGQLIRDATDQIRALSSVLSDPSLPPVPSAFPQGRRSGLQRIAESTWSYLVLQSLFTVNRHAEFLQDLQSLLFLCAAHVLLPQLKHKKRTAEHDCLLNAMHLHIVLVWRDQAAHYHYLRSVLMDCVGAPQVRLEALYQSFHLTPPTDHSFLTKAAAVWSELLDHGKQSEAISFLIGLSRTSLSEHQQEIREMFEETVHGTARKA
jgi:hypothetical protein